jgi:hypothetical protein
LHCYFTIVSEKQKYYGYLGSLGKATTKSIVSNYVKLLEEAKAGTLAVTVGGNFVQLAL